MRFPDTEPHAAPLRVLDIANLNPTLNLTHESQVASKPRDRA